jgi:hypothetical protein
MEAQRPAWWEKTLGNEARSIATLEPDQRAEATRLGLLPAQIAETADMVVVAYRSGGAQGLMTIPAGRYDGLKVLEIFAK